MAKENLKNLTKLNKIVCCLAKSKDLKEIFEGSFYLHQLQWDFFFIFMQFCVSIITFDKDTSFLLGFHSAGIKSNVLAISTPVKRVCVHFLTLGLKSAECSFNIDELLTCQNKGPQSLYWGWSQVQLLKHDQMLSGTAVTKKINRYHQQLTWSWWSWGTTLPQPYLICFYVEKLCKYILWRLCDMQL